MKTSIALIGFMGTGKTVVGKAMAQRLCKEFIETDSLVEQKAGKTIAEIFQQDSEIRFRELEIETVKDVAGKKNVVIACGGGVVLNKINVDRLRKENIIVCLTASPRIILKRTNKDDSERPLLMTANRILNIQDLLRFRKPFYERSADITIDTTRFDIGEVVEEIIKKVK